MLEAVAASRRRPARPRSAATTPAPTPRERARNRCPRRRLPRRRAASAAASLRAGSAIDPGLAYGLIWAGFFAYLGMLWAAARLGQPLVWGLILVLVGGFTVVPVLLSHDVYSYVDYARLGVRHGLDPYVHPPLATPGDPAYADVTWTEATSAYGPLFPLAPYPLAWLPVAVAVAALKAVAAFSVLGIAALT